MENENLVKEWKGVVEETLADMDKSENYNTNYERGDEKMILNNCMKERRFPVI